jgi:hypothetical protein
MDSSSGVLVRAGVPGHGADKGGRCTGGEDYGAAAVRFREVGTSKMRSLPSRRERLDPDFPEEMETLV